MNTETKHAESGCTDYLQHPWESCPENKPAPNKAQHSPDRYTPEQMRERYAKLWEKCTDAQHHADKLAEQLKQCLHTLPLHSKNPVVRQIISESWQTITAYEAAQ